MILVEEVKLLPKDYMHRVETPCEEVTLGLHLQVIKYKIVTNLSHFSGLVTPIFQSWELTVWVNGKVRASAIVGSGQGRECEGELNMHRASDENSWQTHERILNRSTTAIQDEDVVGAGRYILSFLLAGIVGLAIQYGLRKQGWTATWINAAIFVIIVALVAATG